ncbi:MAG TPA: LuxR C-terminal-related transcriptional regulator [Hyphomonas sp.]|nr:LuxR C-terminal-related transcriptional regulator [Hyphomonas sp.]
MFNQFKFSRQTTLTGFPPKVSADWQRPRPDNIQRLSPGRQVVTHLMVPITGQEHSQASSDTTHETESAPVASVIHIPPREREVLLWAARGKTSWETAQLLGLSERTVKFYLSRACDRLNVKNKTHAVAIALTHGLFQI